MSYYFQRLSRWSIFLSGLMTCIACARAAPDVSENAWTPTGADETLRLQIGNVDQLADIDFVQVLVNGVKTGVSGCYISVYPTSEGAFFASDAGIFSSPVRFGEAAAPFQNSQCRVEPAQIMAQAGGGRLNLTITYRFTSSFRARGALHAWALLGPPGQSADTWIPLSPP